MFKNKKPIFEGIISKLFLISVSKPAMFAYLPFCQDLVEDKPLAAIKDSSIGLVNLFGEKP